MAIVDVVWNGLAQALKIASLAETWEVNVAPHVVFGPICMLMSAHFCAAVPNFRIMELDVDDIPWREEFVTRPAQVDRGHLLVPTAPGWGAEVNEAAVRRHPPRT